MMRKKFFTVILSLLLGTFLFAQVSVDPSDNFYSLVESWEMRGVITNVPPLRPYPVNCIIDILETVIKNGTAGDKTVAQFFLDDIKAKNWYVNLDSEFICKTIENENNNPTVSFMTSFYPSVTGDAVTINDKLSIGYKLGLAIRNTQNEINFLPLFSNSEHDAIQYPLTLDMLNAYVDVNGVFSFGTKNLYMQSGIYRNGYGPFLNEGLCLNDQSYHSGNISFTALTDKLSFSQLISVIGATTNVNLDSSNIYYGKFLSFHQVGYSFTKKFSVTYYETICRWD